MTADRNDESKNIPVSREDEIRPNPASKGDGPQANAAGLDSGLTAAERDKNGLKPSDAAGAQASADVSPRGEAGSPGQTPVLDGHEKAAPKPEDKKRKPILKAVLKRPGPKQEAQSPPPGAAMAERIPAPAPSEEASAWGEPDSFAWNGEENPLPVAPAVLTGPGAKAVPGAPRPSAPDADPFFWTGEEAGYPSVPKPTFSYAKVSPAMLASRISAASQTSAPGQGAAAPDTGAKPAVLDKGSVAQAAAPQAPANQAVAPQTLASQAAVSQTSAEEKPPHPPGPEAPKADSPASAAHTPPPFPPLLEPEASLPAPPMLPERSEDNFFWSGEDPGPATRSAGVPPRISVSPPRISSRPSAASGSSAPLRSDSLGPSVAPAADEPGSPPLSGASAQDAPPLPVDAALAEPPSLTGDAGMATGKAPDPMPVAGLLPPPPPPPPPAFDESPAPVLSGQREPEHRAAAEKAEAEPGRRGTPLSLTAGPQADMDKVEDGHADMAVSPEVSWDYGTEFDLSAYMKDRQAGDEPDGREIDPESDPPGTPRPPTDAELVALRELLLKRELALLESFKARFGDPIGRTREISDILPEAIVLTAAKEDEKIERALAPLVNQIFKSSLRGKPHEFANAIFPVMGPAIRRSIAESFRSMVDSFQNSVEMALSWKGLRLRLESLRTGKPFSEVVMLHNLVYRVEQLFLIHRETGLVLNHVVDEGVASQDADMVSAMLTAIQDFVRDCFASGQQGDLESLQLGDYTIIVEQSPYAYLACVVRGNPPMELRQSLRNALELVQVEFLDELSSYKGDSAPFASTSGLLEQCLVSRFHRERPFSLIAKVVPVLTLLLIIGGLAYWRYNANEERRAAALAQQAAALAQQSKSESEQAFLQTMDGYVEKLRREPGILVMDLKDYMDPPWLVTCLRDDLARDPAEVLAEAGAKAGDFTVTTVPYISLEPVIVAKRVAGHIRPPQSVNMVFLPDGTLRLEGTAPVDWIMRARNEALAIPGVNKLDFEKLTDPRMEKLRQLVREVESVKVAFPLGKDTPVPRDVPKLEKAVNTLAELEKLASEMGISVQLTIYGHADSTGDTQRNYEISQARARTLAAMLYGKGSSLPVTLYGMGAEYARQGVTSPLGDQESRRIELRVHLARVTSATPEDLR